MPLPLALSNVLTTETKPRAARLTPAVVRAVEILDLLASSREPLPVSSITRSLDIPRNTAYELLNTLASRDLVRIDSSGRATLGLHLFELGNVFAQSLDLLVQARPIVRELVDACNETAHVAVLDGLLAVYLIKEESTRRVRVLTSVGSRVPAHGTAVGKAILAFQDRHRTLEALRGATLAQLTPSTITDPAVLLAELDVTVRRGYSTDDEESSPEVSCVGAPIRDRSGAVIAGMSVSVPRSRMTTGYREELAQLVVGACDRLSRSLGYAPTNEAPDSQGKDAKSIEEG